MALCALWVPHSVKFLCHAASSRQKDVLSQKYPSGTSCILTQNGSLVKYGLRKLVLLLRSISFPADPSCDDTLVICSYCGFKTDRLRSPVERFMTLLPETALALILLSLYLTLFFLLALSGKKKSAMYSKNILPTFAVYCPRLYSAICVDIF